MLYVVTGTAHIVMFYVILYTFKTGVKYWTACFARQKMCVIMHGLQVLCNCIIIMFQELSL